MSGTVRQNWRLLSLLVVLSLAAGAFLGIAQGGGADAEEALEESFQVLETPSETSTHDALPSGDAQYANIQVVEDATGEVSLAVGSEGACVSTEDASGCAPISATLQGQLATAAVICDYQNGGGRFEIAGAVPDGVEGVDLVFPDGSVSQIQVHSNIYSAVVQETPTEVRGPDGEKLSDVAAGELDVEGECGQ